MSAPMDLDLRIPAEDAEVLRRLSIEKGITATALVRSAVRLYCRQMLSEEAMLRQLRGPLDYERAVAVPSGGGRHARGDYETR